MKSVSTEIIIFSSVEKIWEILSDLENYATWNPFIIYAKGAFKEGEKLAVIQKPPGEKPRLFKRNISKIFHQKEFRWIGRMLLPGIFDAEHIFLLEPISKNQTKLIHKEIYTGLVVPFLWNKIEWSLIAGFNKMNKALKELCEKEETK